MPRKINFEFVSAHIFVIFFITWNKILYARYSIKSATNICIKIWTLGVSVKKNILKYPDKTTITNTSIKTPNTNSKDFLNPYKLTFVIVITEFGPGQKRQQRYKI